MGSDLSIVNDSPDPWRCKVGPDEGELRLSGIVITVVGAIATAVGTAGTTGPLIAGLTANGVVAVFGVPASALATIATGAAAAATYTSVIGGVSGFGMSAAEAVAKILDKDGYHGIPPRESRRWGKMSLSLWQQGKCVKSVLVNETTMRVETLYLRPIFGGATADSNKNHKIQWWIDKWGTEKQEIVAREGVRMGAESAPSCANATSAQDGLSQP